MIDDLEFLRGEATKLQKAIRKDDTRNYKRYAQCQYSCFRRC